MTDIVERLCDPSKGSPRWQDTMFEAANEIERLRAEVARCEASILAWVEAVGECNKDRNRLREALRLADAALSGANMNLRAVEAKVRAALVEDMT